MAHTADTRGPGSPVHVKASPPVEDPDSLDDEAAARARARSSPDLGEEPGSDALLECGMERRKGRLERRMRGSSGSFRGGDTFPDFNAGGDGGALDVVPVARGVHGHNIGEGDEDTEEDLDDLIGRAILTVVTSPQHEAACATHDAASASASALPGGTLPPPSTKCGGESPRSLAHTPRVPRKAGGAPLIGELVDEVLTTARERGASSEDIFSRFDPTRAAATLAPAALVEALLELDVDGLLAERSEEDFAEWFAALAAPPPSGGGGGVCTAKLERYCRNIQSPAWCRDGMAPVVSVQTLGVHDSGESPTPSLRSVDGSDGSTTPTIPGRRLAPLALPVIGGTAVSRSRQHSPSGPEGPRSALFRTTF